MTDIYVPRPREPLWEDLGIGSFIAASATLAALAMAYAAFFVWVGVLTGKF